MDSKGSNHAYQNDSNEAEALWLYLTDNLQRIVCELLIKNQQLRTALIAEQSKQSSLGPRSTSEERPEGVAVIHSCFH